MKRYSSNKRRCHWPVIRLRLHNANSCAPAGFTRCKVSDNPGASLSAALKPTNPR